MAMGLLAMLPTPPAAAEIYRWVDPDGRIHFGDTPPPEGAERLEVRTPVAADAGLEQRRERGERLGEILGEDRAQRESERESREQARADRRRRCDAAQAKLARATRANYIYQDSGDPMNPQILGEEERQRVEDRLRDEVRQYCGAEHSEDADDHGASVDRR